MTKLPTVFCIGCGQEIPQNSRYCPDCGADNRKSLPTLLPGIDVEPEGGPPLPGLRKTFPGRSFVVHVVRARHGQTP